MKGRTMEWIDAKVDRPMQGERVLTIWPLLKYDDDYEHLTDKVTYYVTAVVQYLGDRFEDAPYADCVGYAFDDDSEYAEQPTHWARIADLPAELPPADFDVRADTKRYNQAGAA